MSTVPTQHPLKLFYSYAHADEKLRDKLNTHLANLKNLGYIAPWNDRDISAGQEWEDEIDEHLTSAQIILLLISADFLASDYCYSKEMSRALQRHKAGEAVVIPIILREVDWEKAPFERLQALPKDGKPVTSRRYWHSQDEAFTNVAQGIRLAITTNFRDFKPIPPGDAASSAERRQHSSSSVWNVPYGRNPFFTGREQLLTLLHERLNSTKAAALTQAQAMSGLGGIGKTQTAIEYAYRYQKEYRYVLWVSAATPETLLSDVLKLATLLGVAEQDAQDPERTVAAVRRWLAQERDWLLIVDNADDVTMVRELLSGEGSMLGHLLLTTRAQATGELAHSLDVKKMDEVEGTLLLLRRAKVLEPDAPLEQATKEERSNAEGIVAALDGLPLALDQAGAYIEEMGCPLSDYLSLYQQRRKELLGRRSELSASYPNTVASTWSLSFQRVEQESPAAADLLRVCAFLAPDAIPIELFTEGAPELGKVLSSVVADTFRLNEVLEVLRRYSLLRRNAETKTLSIHRLVQAVLTEGMTAKTRRLWAERAVRAVNHVFPDVDYGTWTQCERYLPQAQSCAELIDHYGLMFSEAADLLYETGYYLYQHARYQEAELLYQRALGIREQVLGLEHPDTADTLDLLARLYQNQGKYEQAELLYQRTLRIYEQALGHEHPHTAATLDLLARLYQAQGKYEQAEPFYQRALRIQEQVPGPEHPSTAATLHDLASLYQAQGKYEQAEPFYQRALRISEQVEGPEHPSTASTLHALATLYQDQGKYEQAEPFYQRALRIQEQVPGPKHPNTAATVHELASLYQAQGKYEQAEPFYQRALGIKEQVLGPEHPSTAATVHELARLYQAQGKYEQAEPLYQRALRIHEQVLGPEHPNTAATLHQLAMLYQAQGKYEQVELLYQRALRIHEQVEGPEHPNTAATLHDLARLYQDQGKYERAEPFYQRALGIYEQVLGPEHPHTAATLYRLATLYQDQGKYEQAEPLYQRALHIREQVLGPEHPDTINTLRSYASLLRATKREVEAEGLEGRAEGD